MRLEYDALSSSVSLTEMPNFRSCSEIKVAVAYKNKITGEITKQYPTDVFTHYDYQYQYHKYYYVRRVQNFTS